MSTTSTIDTDFYEDHFAYASVWALEGIEDFLTSDRHGMWEDSEQRPSQAEFVAHTIRMCEYMFAARYGDELADIAAPS